MYVQSCSLVQVVYLGDTGKLFTTGFSKFSDREYAVWSEDDLSCPLKMESIDSSSGNPYACTRYGARMTSPVLSKWSPSTPPQVTHTGVRGMEPDNSISYLSCAHAMFVGSKDDLFCPLNMQFAALL